MMKIIPTVHVPVICYVDISSNFCVVKNTTKVNLDLLKSQVRKVDFTSQSNIVL